MQDLIQHTINGLSLGSIYALIAIGYTMVYGIMQMINFAHSDIIMIGAFSVYYLNRWLGIETWTQQGHSSFLVLSAALLVAIISCSILGLLIERLAYRPLRNSPKLNILITAIGVSLFLEFTGQVIFGADPKVYPTLFEDSVIFDGGSFSIRILDLVVLAITLTSVLILNFIIYKTPTGRAMRSVSQNPTVAAMFGVNVNRIIAITFILGSSLAGVGSVLVGMKYPRIDPLMGMMIGLKAFIAAVLGGIGNLPGAVVGGLLMGLSESLVVGYVSSTYRDALAFGILIVILLFRPAGLFGTYTVEKV